MLLLLRHLFSIPVRPALASCQLLLVLAACAFQPQKESAPGPGTAFSVVTTFVPITLFTRAVAGDCATVTALIPPAVGPHDFQAKPADLVSLRQARVLVKNGLEIEGFLDRLVASAGNPQLAVIDASKGVTTIASVDSNHGPEHAAHGHSHGAANPHIWLDPLRAVQQVETIRDGLIKADPGCAAGYRRRATAYTDALRHLHNTLAAELKPYAGRTFVAFHAVTPYFAQRYGLRASFLVDVPEVNPSPADLRRVAEVVKANQLQALLSGPQEGHWSFNALAQDLGIKVSVFDPIETADAQAASDPDSYLRLMRRNADAVIQALAR